MSDDLIKRLNAEIYAIMGPQGADYSEEPVTFYIEAATALAEAQAEIARLRSLIGRYGMNVGDAEGVDYAGGPFLSPAESAEVSALIDAVEAARAALSPVAPDQGEG